MPRVDPEDMANELALMARNDGDAYRDDKNAASAVNRAYRDYIRRWREDADETYMELREKLVRELERHWSET